MGVIDGVENALKGAEKKFVSIMEVVGKDAKKGLAIVSTYLPEAAALAKIIFPAQAATIDSVVNVTGLVQAAVVSIEQKYAALGASNGTGAQKLADVMSIVSPTVTDLLTKAGLHVDTAYITKIVNAVVGILNVQLATA